MLGPLISLAATFLEGHTAKKKAEARIRTKAATSVDDWEKLQATASGNSWKDEAWTITFIAIIAACFIPPCQPYVERGFAFLSLAPDWFQWAAMASIAASFGIKGIARMRMR